MTRKLPIRSAAAVLCLALAGWGAWKWRRSAPADDAPAVPTTAVKRGDVRITVTADGELHGGNSEMLTAPMTGGQDMVLTYLRRPGELVEAGDVVATFDTTEQEFALREAEADLAEAEQQLRQAKSEAEAREEEIGFTLVHAAAEVRVAELEAQKNPLLASITARQNTLAVEAARDRLRELEKDVANRRATNRASVAIQEAARSKAKVAADMAQRNIDLMTLRAKSGGYVSVQQNTNSNFYFFGMQLPILQVGDTLRAGMAVAQIPDLHQWEVSAQIGELDRGHLAAGQEAQVSVVALPGKKLSGKVKNIGGTTGPPWERRFECRVAVNNPVSEMRPGMSTRIVIVTGLLSNVIWVPSQALFESDGRTFVYLSTKSGFVPVDVKLVRRSESTVVLSGLPAGQRVALASPTEPKEKKGDAGVLRAMPKP